MIRKPDKALQWQSKAVLLLVVPWTAASVILQAHWWITQVPVVAWTTLGISGIFGLIVWQLKAATPGGAATGAAITASLMFSTARYPYTYSWLHGALMPLLAVFLLTYVATKIGRTKKERLGTGEDKRGRNAAQVAANLGVAALVASPLPLQLLNNYDNSIYTPGWLGPLMAIMALSEAAADTVSSEIGQVMGGQPRMFTTFKKVEKGTDGGITFAGTLAGFWAAAVIGIVFIISIYIGPRCDPGMSCHLEMPDDRLPTVLITAAAGTFGMIFDSLLGAVFERRGWLNNDAVNFLSTLSSIVFAAGIIAVSALMM